MKVVKIVLFILFTILCLNETVAQEANEWSSWKSDEIFENLEVRFRISEEGNSDKFLEVECRNNFSSNLTFFLVFASHLKKTNTIKLEINPEQTLKIKSKKNIETPQFDIYTTTASFTPGWAKDFNLQQP